MPLTPELQTLLLDNLGLAHEAAREAFRYSFGHILLDDLVQTAIVRMIYRLPTYDPARGSLRGYLHKDLRGYLQAKMNTQGYTGRIPNQCGRGLSNKGHRYRYPEPLSKMNDPADSRAELTPALEPEEVAALHRVLAVLEPQTAEIVRLYYLEEGNTLTTLAQRFACSRQNIEQHLQRGLARLRIVLGWLRMCADD